MKTSKVRLAFVGHAGAGKDLATALVKRALFAIANDNKQSAIVDINCILHNTSQYLLEHSCNSQSNFINILRFADPLKHYIALMEQVDVSTTFEQSYKLSIASKAFAKSEIDNFSIRDVHLKLSDALKKTFGDNHFVQYMHNALEHRKDVRNIIVADCRYPNEVELLKQHGFKFVKLVNQSNEVDAPQHSSESFVDEIAVDCVLRHDGKNAQKFAAAIDEMMLKLFKQQLIELDRFAMLMKLHHMDVEAI